MEIVLNCGDKINVPEGCKATIEDGVITIVREKVEFKDGDILISKRKTNIVIFKEQYDDYCFRSYYNSAGYEDDNDWDIEAFCPATEEEKQNLIHKMAEKGLRWNAEEKRVEKIRWRAKQSQSYFFIDKDINSTEEEESGDAIDDMLWRKFNYFRTKEQTEKAAELVKETLKKFHEENS